MNTTEMAIRSIIRKPIKSLLLLLIIFTISNFIIAGIAGKDANIATQDTARQAIGAGFILEGNEANRHLRSSELSEQIGDNVEGNKGGFYQKKVIVNGSESWMTWTDNMFETLKIDDIESIATVSGIADYNITTAVTAVNPVNFLRIEDSELDQSADVQGISLIGNQDMTMDSNVLTGNVTIKEGRFVNAQDQDSCVISEELAALNGVSLGDSLQFNDYHDTTNAQVYSARIIGIYQVKQDMIPYMYSDTYRSENVIFTDLRFPEKAEGNIDNPLYASAYFKVTDVNDYDQVKANIKERDIDWERYDLIDKNGNLDTMATNFHNLQGMSILLLWIILGSSSLISFLVCMFWIKSRMHEICILLALGNSKLQVLRQIIIEALMIAVISLLLSFIVAPLVADSSAHFLVEQQVQQVTEQQTLNEGNVEKPFTTPQRSVQGVQVNVSTKILLYDGLCIIFLIISCILISGVLFLKRSIKEMLSDMN